MANHIAASSPAILFVHVLSQSRFDIKVTRRINGKFVQYRGIPLSWKKQYGKSARDFVQYVVI